MDRLLPEGLDPSLWEDAMSFRISGRPAIATFVAASILASAQSLAANAYITNFDPNTVSVIDTATNTVVATIPANKPAGVAVSRDGSRVYVVGGDSPPGGNVSVIDASTNTVIA